MTTRIDETYSQITAYSQEADRLFCSGAYGEAAEHYQQAWELLPEPLADSSASGWLLTAMGDARFLCREYARAHEVLLQARALPTGMSNPFLHLRLGQCEFELGQFDQAATELWLAYQGAGLQVFESEDPKYLAFLRSRMSLSSSGW